jgi:hypothetical protein
MIMAALKACSPWITREETAPKEAADIFLRLTSREAMCRWFDIVVREKRIEAESKRKQDARLATIRAYTETDC